MTSTEKMMVIIKSIAGMFGLVVVFMGGMALMDRFGLFNRTGAIIWGISLAISMVLACVVLGWVGWHVLGERVYRQARAGGLPAQARVLEVKMTGVRRRRRHHLMPEREHILRVVNDFAGEPGPHDERPLFVVMVDGVVVAAVGEAAEVAQVR